MARPPTPTRREGPGQPKRPEPFEPTPGLVVAGKYCVERVIGEGGMGIVVAATHEGLDQRVAIKFLLPDAMRNDDVVERFLREAKVAARVNSEYVARVTDVGKTEPDGIPFIVMEYLEGQDLGQMIDESGPLPLEEAAEIGLQACEALVEVHGAGIIHRDLKPSNLFVTRRADGSPCLKLLDFGISKFTSHPSDESADPALTATATIMGSPSYMSPEQLKSTKEVDSRTDVWALGAVLYEAFTGKPAFRGETVPQVCFLIGSEQPAAPSSLRPDIPPPVEQAVLACLDKKVETRATLVDLARALVAFAPPRAQVSLERVEGKLGEAPSLPRRSRDASLPVVRIPSASSHEGARTQQSWHDDQPRKRRGGGGLLAFLLLSIVGVFGFGVYTGRINITGVKEPIAGATSAMSSAFASAAAEIPSTLPSSIPSTITSSMSAVASAVVSAMAAPSAEPSSAPDASDDDAEEDDDDSPEPSASPSGSVLAVVPGHPSVVPHVPAAHHPAAHPRHHGHRPYHKKR